MKSLEILFLLYFIVKDILSYIYRMNWRQKKYVKTFLYVDKNHVCIYMFWGVSESYKDFLKRFLFR